MRLTKIQQIAIIIFIFLLTTTLHIKISQFEPKKKSSENQIPIIQIHLEEPSKDPLLARKLEFEKRADAERIEFFKEQEKNDNKLFNKLLLEQSQNLGILEALESKLNQ